MSSVISFPSWWHHSDGKTGAARFNRQKHQVKPIPFFFLSMTKLDTKSKYHTGLHNKRQRSVRMTQDCVSNARVRYPVRESFSAKHEASTALPRLVSKAGAVDKPVG